MENMHRAYEKYKARGFEILSLSLDNKPETALPGTESGEDARAGTWREEVMGQESYDRHCVWHES